MVLKPPVPDVFFGERVIAGKPFTFGRELAKNVVLLERDAVEVQLGGARATYLLVVHVAADVKTNYLSNFADSEIDGNTLGGEVSRYTLRYEDGETYTKPILRRFAIQQARIGWGASPVAAVPAREDHIFRSVAEELAIGNAVTQPHGLSETRHISARDHAIEPGHASEFLWIYALANPSPERALEAVVLTPSAERSALYALTLTELVEHPLRAGVRRKLRLTIPHGANLNPIGELDDIDIDIGTVISARAALEYDHRQWSRDDPVVHPTASESSVVVEYVAHPAARLYVGSADGPIAYDLTQPDAAVTIMPPLQRLVRLRIVDADGGDPVAVRLHIHGESGEYLPPRGHHRQVNGAWFEDNYGEFVAGGHQYSYVDGECLVDLPVGTVHIEITRGYEIAPIRRSLTIDTNTELITFELEKVLRWRERGWVSADTHVHFLSPQTALLEGEAEGVNVVNLLASQWGEMSSNVADFDGRTTFGSKEFGGAGEFLVRVGSENRMQVLGHISLLGYAGALIHPLCTGGPSESAVGDPLEVTMAEWAKRCLDQGGLVVMPHAPNPQLERAADIVLGLVDAIELAIFNPLVPDGGLSAYGLADWYRYLNLGYHVPLVAGSDKMAASMLLGGARTYAHLDAQELTYETWLDAVRRGDTFATIGPLATLRVEHVRPGGRLELPPGGGTVVVEWEVESVSVPIDRIEIVAGGLVVGETTCVAGTLVSAGTVSVPVATSTWIALRVRGGYHGHDDDIAAHTSAVLVEVGGSQVFSETDAALVLDQIQGAIAYVDTLAPLAEVRRQRELRAGLEAAYKRLHARMHRAGLFHTHPLHDPSAPHEH